MKFLLSIGLLVFSFSTFGQGIYSDFGIERIYCFSNSADIEIELSQKDDTLHTFMAKGGDIFNVNETLVVEGVSNGVSFYLPNLERSTIVVIIDDEDNVRFEGLSALTGSKEDYQFECELN